jgi:hypothetical protein
MFIGSANLAWEAIHGFLLLATIRQNINKRGKTREVKRNNETRNKKK